MSDAADTAAFVPHKPNPDLRGTILYVVRMDHFGKLSKRDQDRLIELNPQAHKKASVFYVGQTALLAHQRYENHLNGYKASRWVNKYGKSLIRVDEWKSDFGVALPEKALRTAVRLGQQSDRDPGQREQELTELLRAYGDYVVSN